jgi:3-deoxy-7-phosphoheptulonate synthase
MRHVANSRQAIENIIQGKDKRLLAIVGPCSVHDKTAALEYAQKLKHLADELNDKLCIVMRVYFEKPRTTVGWKGLINDPHLDNSFAVNEGLQLARALLLEINQMGVMAATEFVDTITPQYIADLISWAAIGARTTESQAHRMLASGLSMPVGFKNNTSGNVNAAVNAVLAASRPHHFLGITQTGTAATVATQGNPCCHIVLRGGSRGTNYDPASIQKASALLTKRNLRANVLIDCSHDNCNKDYTKQCLVIESLCQQLQNNEHHIMGLMLESHLIEGRQTLQADEKLNYGQSITDGCIGWNETETLLRKLANAVIP